MAKKEYTEDDTFYALTRPDILIVIRKAMKEVNFDASNYRTWKEWKLKRLKWRRKFFEDMGWDYQEGVRAAMKIPKIFIDENTFVWNSGLVHDAKMIYD